MLRFLARGVKDGALGLALKAYVNDKLGAIFAGDAGDLRKRACEIGDHSKGDVVSGIGWDGRDGIGGRGDRAGHTNFEN